MCVSSRQHVPRTFAAHKLNRSVHKRARAARVTPSAIPTKIDAIRLQSMNAGPGRAALFLHACSPLAHFDSLPFELACQREFAHVCKDTVLIDVNLVSMGGGRKR